tara:strand:+ start:1495 stop:2223 length:729 start_codon:yes stop_codon:yes gene_type:complete
MKTILLDADMLVYRAAFASETETKWDEDTWTLTCKESDMKREVITFMYNLSETMDSTDIVPVFSTSTNYRYGLWPDYKANRKDKRKPVGLKWLIGWVTETYKGISEPNIEADDWIGILATRDPENTIAVSGDKDFETLPVTWYNPLKNETKTTSPEEARRFHLVQALAGDPADGYKGAKGVGIIGAKKLLDKQGYTWDTVVSAYTKAGQTEEDALLNARLAYILHDKDYNEDTKEITLWTPA